MDKDGIQIAILNRLDAMESSCNQWHLYHNDGVLRGLLWAFTGTDPGTHLSDDVQNVLNLAGFETKLKNDKVLWRREGEEWSE
jgi:hypothetical protein